MEKILRAPIPGQSLTKELGAYPWQKPPKLSTVQEALEHYATKITDPEINDSLLDALEMGTPVTSIAEIVVQSSAMEGIHTIDVSILILPLVMELIAYVADEAEIDYNMGLDENINLDKVSESKINLVMQELNNKKIKLKEEEPSKIVTDNLSTNGLMARRA